MYNYPSSKSTTNLLIIPRGPNNSKYPKKCFVTHFVPISREKNSELDSAVIFGQRLVFVERVQNRFSHLCLFVSWWNQPSTRFSSCMSATACLWRSRFIMEEIWRISYIFVHKKCLSRERSSSLSLLVRFTFRTTRIFTYVSQIKWRPPVDNRAKNHCGGYNVFTRAFTITLISPIFSQYKLNFEVSPLQNEVCDIFISGKQEVDFFREVRVFAISNHYVSVNLLFDNRNALMHFCKFDKRLTEFIQKFISWSGKIFSRVNKFAFCWTCMGIRISVRK